MAEVLELAVDPDDSVAAASVLTGLATVPNKLKRMREINLAEKARRVRAARAQHKITSSSHKAAEVIISGVPSSSQFVLS